MKFLLAHKKALLIAVAVLAAATAVYFYASSRKKSGKSINPFDDSVKAPAKIDSSSAESAKVIPMVALDVADQSRVREAKEAVVNPSIMAERIETTEKVTG